MTHWKKAFNSDYLSSSDIEDKDLVLTIKNVAYQECMTQSGKKFCNVAYFTDTVMERGKCIKGTKPMILNVGNSKIVKAFSGNKTQIEEWIDIKIQVYVDQKVRFGNDTVEGLRIRSSQPKTQKQLPEITEANFSEAVKFLLAGKTIEDLKKHRRFDSVMENKLKEAAK